MTPLARLLLDLGREGIEVALHPIDSTRLRHRPPFLSPELLERLRSHRAEITELLRQSCAPSGACAGNAYIYAERLGIADGLGMPTHPGAPAWLVAVGESMSECE